MRVVIAPGSFGPALPAVEAAAAIAQGWARRAPGDDLVLAPVSDGGGGYVDVLHQSLGGELLAVSVSDIFGTPAPGVLLVVGATTYVEAGHAVGLGHAGGDPEAASSFGAGQLIAEAIRAGAERIVVGVGARGVACNDGGAGLLAALGAVSRPADALRHGSRSLDTLRSVDLAPLLDLVGGRALVLATDDDVPLLGLLGTTNAAGRARGLSACCPVPEQVAASAMPCCSAVRAGRRDSVPSWTRSAWRRAPQRGTSSSPARRRST
jgi:glycerate 2-kinase